MLRVTPIPLGLLTRLMRNLQAASPCLNYRRWELAWLLTTSRTSVKPLPQPNANTPAGVNIDFAQNTADSLRASLALAVEGSAMRNAIKATLAYHTAAIKGQVEGDPSLPISSILW
jgi:hypothetical protein